jgi:type II secretory pathway pseudopilin PulG
MRPTKHLTHFAVRSSMTQRIRLGPYAIRSCKRRASGFTYVVLLASIVIFGIVGAVAEEVASLANRREKEAELLFRGNAYARAIKSFHQANGRYPRDLQELLADQSATKRRHLRFLYSDPMTQKEGAQWQIVKSPDGGISGVASLSDEEPLKKANFPPERKHFEQAKTYQDWIFDYAPRVRGMPSQPGGPERQVAPQVLPQTVPVNSTR